MGKLKAGDKGITDQNDYLRKTLLEEYIRRFETRVHASEKEQYQLIIKEARETNDNPASSAESVFTKQLTVVQAALDRLDNLLGGHVYDGSALNTDGIAGRGVFAMIGPLVVFAGNDGRAGLAEQLRGSTDATLIDIGPEHQAGIAAVVGSGSGQLPLDSTMGNALKIRQVEETWWEHINKGGVVIWPLLALGLAASLVALVKWVQLANLRRIQPSDLQSILDHVNDNDTASALALAKRIRGPAGELLQTAIQNAGESKEMIEEILYEKMLHTKPKLERLLPFLSLTAATSPLLGLLGTVTGMINTFKLITVFGTGDPKRLSSGISEALVTTEYGLIIAVPCLLLFALLSRKAKGILASMEQTAVGFVNGLAARNGR
ncbi:MAG: MotA/TolQ/ExbB proton channel family protein [Pedosphaera sp.]|nr:MotA/TolQ/ExbB proton channel family protein [Pedosphaera sp.]